MKQFVANRVAGSLNRRLPPFPRPKCSHPGCAHYLAEPRPYRTDDVVPGGTLKVHLLGKCDGCGAAHKGERVIKLGRRSLAVSQAFRLFTENDREELATLLPRFQQQQEQLAQIHAMPVKD